MTYDFSTRQKWTLRIFGFFNSLNPFTMSEAEEVLPQRTASENQCGVILGCWDHEKTPLLIQDLERSVSLVEQKCKNLLEELTNYKKYLEDSGKPNARVFVFKRKNKKLKNSQFFSGRYSDLSFEKNLIHLQEIQRVFEEKFREKLFNINKELADAAQKLGLGNHIVLFSTNDYLKKQQVPIEDEEKKSCSDAQEKFSRLNFSEAKIKSDHIMLEGGEEAEFSKITQNKLLLYQKLSRLRIKKRKKKINGKGVASSKGKQLRLFNLKRTPKRRQKTLIREAKSRNAELGEKKFKKITKGLKLPQKSLPPRDPCSRINSQEIIPESKIVKMCKSLTEALSKNSNKLDFELTKGEQMTESNPVLGAAVRKAVPFTTCTSTSRSFNIGLNVQQLLSLAKHLRKSSVRTSVSEKAHESAATKNTAVNSNQFRTDLEKRHSVRCSPEIHNFQKGKVCHLAQKGKVWISGHHNATNFRRVRSKYTGSLPEGFLEYHTSSLSQYTNGRESVIRTESKTAYTVGSRIMVSDCQRTNIFEAGSNNKCFRNASGDYACNENCSNPSVEWKKVNSSFVSTYRKYISLKEKISANGLALAGEELKSLEIEIDYAIEKYKEFLRFYYKFLQLSHRLKSLKIACETKLFGPETPFSSNYDDKLSCSYSLLVRKVFREIQALQDKINLVHEYS